MTTTTGIKILYQARFWSNAFKNNVACEVREISEGGERGSKTRYTLEPDQYTFIALQPSVKYEIVVGVVQVLFSNIILHTAKTYCKLKEDETQNFVFTPPAISLGRSVLVRE